MSSSHAAGVARLEQELGRNDWDESSIQRMLGRSTNTGFVAISAGQHLGHVLTSRVLDECEILTVAVAPVNRRQRIAWRLFQRLFERFGTGGVYLEVRESNRGARALYSKLGFVDVGRRSAYYQDGEDALVMRVLIGGASDGS